jgi:hypothetical protein
MTFVRPDRWRIIVPLYAVGGFVLGLGEPLLRTAATRFGKPPGVGTALDVNLFMPLLAIVLAFLYPRLATACIGAALATGAFHIGAHFAQNPFFWRWTFMGVVGAIHPILPVACLGYAGVGMLTAALVRPWRDVGPPDTPLRCDVCGYLLINLTQARCPECGTTFDATRIARHTREADYDRVPPQ